MNIRTTTKRRRLVAGVAAAAALALGLTACSGGGGGTSLTQGDSGGSDSSTSGSGGSSGGDLTPFTVAMVSSLDTEPYFYAKSQGYYKDVGLKVSFDQSNSGPALVTGVINGTYDAGSAAAFPVLIAIGKGAPIKLYPGATVVGEGLGNSGLVVQPDSGITGYKDLAGKTVATNALTSLTTLGLKIGLKKAGVDPESIKITALPFKSSVQAVAQGQADAAVVISPFQTIAKNNGLEVIGDPIGENLPAGAPYNIMFTNAKNSQKLTKEFQAFNKATLRAVKELKGNEKLQRRLAQTEIGLTKEVAQSVPLPGYSTSGIDVDALQKYADLVAEFGYTKKPVDVSKVVVNP